MALLPGGVLRSVEGNRLHFWCPGCDEVHGIKYAGGDWTWNGNTAAPTFSPSVLVRTGHYLYGTQYLPNKVAGKDPCWCTWNRDHPNDPAPFICYLCHSFVTDGRIQFLGDCTHALVGQTVALPPWPNLPGLITFASS